MTAHKERKHSKFSASGAERWTNCSGSIALSEGLPDKPSPWSAQGTRAHEVLEAILTKAKGYDASTEMAVHAWHAANFIFKTAIEAQAELTAEKRIALDFIHPEMFGTYDAAVVEHFGTLHVFDYKYGMTPVSPAANLQMLFYGIGLAHKYDWNFEKVRLWIIQPRIPNYMAPTYWDVSIDDLKNKWLPVFEEGVMVAQMQPHTYTEGSWCHFCKAKAICPAKLASKNEQAAEIFSGGVMTKKQEKTNKEAQKLFTNGGPSGKKEKSKTED